MSDDCEKYLRDVIVISPPKNFFLSSGVTNTCGLGKACLLEDEKNGKKRQKINRLAFFYLNVKEGENTGRESVI